METINLIEVDEKLKSHFLNLYSIALSDTELDTEELKTLYEIGSEKGISAEAINEIIQNPHKVRFHEPETIYEKVESLYDLTRMVWADGRVDPREIHILSSLCKRLGFLEENVHDLIEFFVDSVKNGVTREEILKIVESNLEA